MDVDVVMESQHETASGNLSVALSPELAIAKGEALRRETSAVVSRSRIEEDSDAIESDFKG